MTLEDETQLKKKIFSREILGLKEANSIIFSSDNKIFPGYISFFSEEALCFLKRLAFLKKLPFSWGSGESLKKNKKILKEVAKFLKKGKSIKSIVVRGIAGFPAGNPGASEGNKQCCLRNVSSSENLNFFRSPSAKMSFWRKSRTPWAFCRKSRIFTNREEVFSSARGGRFARRREAVPFTSRLEVSKSTVTEYVKEKKTKGWGYRLGLIRVWIDRGKFTKIALK